MGAGGAGAPQGKAEGLRAGSPQRECPSPWSGSEKQPPSGRLWGAARGAAPGRPENPANLWAAKRPTIGVVFVPAGVKQTPKIGDSRSAPKPAPAEDTQHLGTQIHGSNTSVLKERQKATDPTTDGPSWLRADPPPVAAN